MLPILKNGRRSLKLKTFKNLKWNLRLNGLPESKDENTRQRVMEVIRQMVPDWAPRLDIILDSVHRPVTCGEVCGW